ncbi:MAG: hypothetical protein NTZ74_14630 [Chloroflexi bacterium]|nr:hypothetical protein [Chloroflexota bacterium]
MATNIKKVAQYAQFSDDIKLDLLVEDFLRSNPILGSVQKPDTDDQRTLAVAASLLELFAIRFHKEAPTRTSEIGAIDVPYFIQSDAITSKWFRDLCLIESPEPLRKRNIYATGNYLLRV